MELSQHFYCIFAGIVKKQNLEKNCEHFFFDVTKKKFSQKKFFPSLGRMLFIFQVRLTNYRLLRFLKYLAGLHEGRWNDVTTFLENIIMDHKYQEEYLIGENFVGEK